MNQFMKEYNDADLTNAKFHKDATERKICFDKNNARNRCWYTEESAANRLNLVENDYELERMMYGGEILVEDNMFYQNLEGSDESDELD